MTALLVVVIAVLAFLLILFVFAVTGSSERLKTLSVGHLEVEAQREFDEVLGEILEERVAAATSSKSATWAEAGNAQGAQPVARELALMRKYHAQGLAQSRLSFILSLVFAGLGFLVIVFAIVTTDASKPISAQSLPFASLVSATVIEAVSALFFVQSNRAQKVMVEFFDKLRADRRLEEALSLAERMPEPMIRARMMLILGLGLAERRITDSLMRDTMGLGPSAGASADGQPKAVVLD